MIGTKKNVACLTLRLLYCNNYYNTVIIFGVDLLMQYMQQSYGSN